MVRKHSCPVYATRQTQAERLLVLGLTSLTLFAQPAPAPRGKALVIGNEQYAHLNRIPAAKLGSHEIALALKSLQFKVDEEHDLTLDGLTRVIEKQFVSDLKPNEVCLVYYSGYGLQRTLQRTAVNYFVPVDFDPNTKGDVAEVAYEIGRMQSFLKGRLKILWIEASWESTQLARWAGTTGLAAPQSDSDTVWLFDAGPNTTTEVPAAGPGLFTSSLSRALSTTGSPSGLSLADVIQSVPKEVDMSSRARQQPYSINAGSFYFIEPPPAPSQPPVIIKEDIWPKQRTIERNKDHQDYVYIPKKAFRMGCVPSPTAKCEVNEKPQHTVEITNSFWLGETEVQVEAYKYFAKNVKHGKMPQAPMWDRGWKVGEYPMAYVSWEDAQDYCKWAGGRLPTEAEWEYAARAGTENQVYPFADMQESRNKANFIGKEGYDTYDQAAPVKKFDPSRFGLFDMAGNVWEWVSDFYDPQYYEHSPKIDPLGPKSGKGHVARGGSYDSDREKQLRLSYRGHFEGTADHLGFRCLLPDTPEVRAQFPDRAGR